MGGYLTLFYTNMMPIFPWRGIFVLLLFCLICHENENIVLRMKVAYTLLPLRPDANILATEDRQKVHALRSFTRSDRYRCVVTTSTKHVAHIAELV